MVSYSGSFPTTSAVPVPQPPLDKLGAQADADGTLNSVIQYTAFGEIRSTQGITPTKYRYTGQLAQAELGLDYYVARWYDPLTGHFTQADTLVPEPGKASAYDRYAYVQNNPIRYKDPSGHDVGCAGTDASNCVKKNSPLIRNLGYRTYATKAESEEEFNNLQNSAANHDNTDAEFMYRMFTSTTQPGSSSKERLSYFLQVTNSGPYQQFALNFGDTGFSVEFRDGANQVNHFLEAAKIGSAQSRSNPIILYFLDSMAIGHELSGDERYGGGKGANFWQTIYGVNPIVHVLFYKNTLKTDVALFLAFHEPPRSPLGYSNDATGNSVQDLQLTRKGIEFGEAILSGRIDSNDQAAIWLLNNICANATSCH